MKIVYLSPTHGSNFMFSPPIKST